MRAVVLVAAILSATTAFAQELVDRREAPAALDRLFVWEPQWRDITLDPSDEKRQALTYLLTNGTARKYIVKAGDTLDSVIRTAFLVSSSDQPNAYRLYLAEVIRRNRDRGLKDNLWLVPGQELILPGAPQFAALEMGVAQRAGEYAKQFARATGRQVTASVATLATAVDQLRHFTAATTDAEAQRELVERGIIPAASENAKLFQLVPYEATGFESRAVVERSLNRFLPASSSPPAECQGTCDPARKVLWKTFASPKQPREKAAAAAMISTARLLVLDSGVHDWQTRAVQTLSDGDLGDVSDNGHGTYVYDEIVGGALVPSSRVWVGRIAVSDAGGYKFDLDLIRPALFAFQGHVTVARQEPVTGIVSISASGDPGGASIPPIATVEQLLVVAAAGNDASQEVPTRHVFARENARGKNLLIVGALSPDGSRAAYSNWHSENVDLYAQGSCICGTTGKQLNGTSQAAPIVAVAASLVASAFPQLSPLDVKWRLISSSDIRTDLAGVGGALNLERALARRIRAIVVSQNLDEELELDVQKVSFAHAAAHWQPLISRGALRVHNSRAFGDYVGFDRTELGKAPTWQVIPRHDYLTLHLHDGAVIGVRPEFLKAIVFPPGTKFDAESAIAPSP